MVDDTSKPAIPENVIVALGKARESGKYNMLDMHRVVRLILRRFDRTAALWLDDNPDRYMEALLIMGERVRLSKEGKENEA